MSKVVAITRPKSSSSFAASVERDAIENCEKNMAASRPQDFTRPFYPDGLFFTVSLDELSEREATH